MTTTNHPLGATSILLWWSKRHWHMLGLSLVALTTFYAVDYARFTLFGANLSWEVTLVFAPISEEGWKLGLVLLLLVGLNTLSSGVSDGAVKPGVVRRTRLMMMSMPLTVGCLFAALEEVGYFGEPTGSVVYRFFTHMATVALGFAACLHAWRRWTPLSGLLTGLGVGASIHAFGNSAYYWPVSQTGLFQFEAMLVVFTVTVYVLWITTKKEPASSMAKELMP